MCSASRTSSSRSYGSRTPLCGQVGQPGRRQGPQRRSCPAARPGPPSGRARAGRPRHRKAASARTARPAAPAADGGHCPARRRAGRVRAPVTSSASPAIIRRSSRPIPALSSRPATSAHSAGVRTEWSSRIRASHSGYQSRLASSSTAAGFGRRAAGPDRCRTAVRAHAGPGCRPRPAPRRRPEDLRAAYSSTRADSTHSVTERRRSGPAVVSHPDRIATLRRSLVRSRFRARPARAPRFVRERCRPPEPTRPCRHRCGRSERSSPGRR